MGQSAPMLCENHHETILKMIAYRLGVPMSVVFVFLFRTWEIEESLLYIFVSYVPLELGLDKKTSQRKNGKSTKSNLLFGNNTEAVSLAKSLGWNLGEDKLEEIALRRGVDFCMSIFNDKLLVKNQLSRKGCD